MKKSQIFDAVKKFFKDKHGKWVIAQFPNFLMFAWLTLLLINFFAHDQNISVLQNAVLFTWAYLELTEGSSYFRKTLGAIVLIGLVVSFFL
ncbi:hypothetical protein EOL73_03560 [Candidatus Saccharibacteria bacterium]|nr:hypothetical protein [Candidatus Saccharibacteria bacterium]NCU40807.1 hypothetical protein [Candidatus Saccharibacteria bacterium]